MQPHIDPHIDRTSTRTSTAHRYAHRPHIDLHIDRTLTTDNPHIAVATHIESSPGYSRQDPIQLGTHKSNLNAPSSFSSRVSFWVVTWNARNDLQKSEDVPSRATRCGGNRNGWRSSSLEMKENRSFGAARASKLRKQNSRCPKVESVA